MKKLALVHPMLFAMLPILTLYFSNRLQTSPFEILLPTVIALGFTILVLVLLRMLLKDILKAAILVSGFWVLFSHNSLFYLFWNLATCILHDVSPQQGHKAHLPQYSTPS